MTYAQQTSCDELWFIVATPSDPVTNNCATGGSTDCFRLDYPVYFFANGSSSSTIQVTDLQISGTVSGGAIDEDKSSSCAANFTLSVSNDGTQFTYTQDPNQVVTITVNNGTVNPTILLNIIVEAQPNAEVSFNVDHVSFYYATPPQAYCEVPMSRIIHESPTYTMSTPANCTDDAISFSLGDKTSIDLGTHIQERIPIVFNSNGLLSIQELDFQLTLTDLNGHLAGVGIEAENGSNGNFVFTGTVEMSGNNVYRIYGSKDELQQIDGTDGHTIGYLLLDRPSLDNVSIDVEIRYDFARLHLADATGECCSPVVNPGTTDPPYQLTLAGDEYCTDITVSIQENEEMGVGDCTEPLPLASYFVIIRNTGTVPATFDLMQLRLRFISSGNITLTDVIYDEQLCPASCPFECFTPTLPSTEPELSYAYCGMGNNSFTINPNDELTFRVYVSGEPGACVRGIYFREAHLVYQGGSPVCAPVFSNFEDLSCTSGSVYAWDGRITKEPDGSGIPTGIELVEVKLDAGQNSPCSTGANPDILTGSGEYCGEYQWCTSCEESYTVMPYRNDDALCGVTTLDLVFIMRHILLLEPLNSPYKLIAADANNDGHISTLDMAVLKKLILMLIEELPNNTAWRFVDANYVFPNPQDPWVEAFPESVHIPDVSTGGSIDFIGIKIGDINLTCLTCDGMLQEQTSPNKVLLYIDNQASYQAGDTISLDFQVKDFSAFNSYQLGIGFDTTYLSYVAVTPADLSGVTAENGEDFSINEAKGQIRTLWYDNAGGVKSLSDGSSLFRLQFIAKTAIADMTDKIYVSDSILGSWAYDNSNLRHPFDFRYWDGLNFNSIGDTETTVPVQKNYNLRIVPNPFKESVEIQLLLHEAQSINLALYDMQGRLLWHQPDAQKTAGRHNWILPTDELERGVYVLRIKCGEQLFVRRLIKQ